MWTSSIILDSDAHAVEPDHSDNRWTNWNSGDDVKVKNVGEYSLFYRVKCDTLMYSNSDIKTVHISVEKGEIGVLSDPIITGSTVTYLNGVYYAMYGDNTISIVAKLTREIPPEVLVSFTMFFVRDNIVVSLASMIAALICPTTP